MNGALVIDKPAGMSSHDVVQAVRRLLGERRVGHLGTLDPFATGVLVLLTGRATRLARFFAQREKTYRGVIRFGYATDTMDGTGSPLSDDTCPELSEAVLRHAFDHFVGPYAQRPPAFSAKKVSGTPAYRLARKGIPVELRATPVVVHSLRLSWMEGPRAGFETTVSSGTYVRSLVNDLGEHLNVGAHLEQLRRTSVGEFTERSAVTLKGFAARLEKGEQALIDPGELLADLPAADLDEAGAARAAHGAHLRLNLEAERVRLMHPGGGLLGIAERVSESLYHPVVVLVTEDERARLNQPGRVQPAAVGENLLKTMLVLCGAAY